VATDNLDFLTYRQEGQQKTAENKKF